jgi:hypothetical protein
MAVLAPKPTPAAPPAMARPRSTCAKRLFICAGPSVWRRRSCNHPNLRTSCDSAGRFLTKPSSAQPASVRTGQWLRRRTFPAGISSSSGRSYGSGSPFQAASSNGAARRTFHPNLFFDAGFVVGEQAEPHEHPFQLEGQGRPSGFVEGFGQAQGDDGADAPGVVLPEVEPSMLHV